MGMSSVVLSLSILFYILFTFQIETIVAEKIFSISESTALNELNKFGSKINATCQKKHISFDNNCDPKKCTVLTLGSGMSRRTLCKHVEKPCYMLSYGVGPNYSYDTEINRRFNCTIFMFDPTVNYPAEVSPGLKILFYN
jgi:hypothetical protein